MKIAFIAPRYHTNQHFWVKSLLGSGHQVEFMTLYEGRHENHELVEPRVLGIASRILRRASTLSDVERRRYLIRNGRPVLRQLWSALRLYRPDVVIVRNPNYAFGRMAVALAKLRGCRVLLYTQSPLWVESIRPSDRAKAALAAALDTVWITPVEFRGMRRPPVKRSRMVLLPFACEPGPSDRAPNDGPLRLLAVGKFIRRKNHHVLLELMRSGSWTDAVRLTIVGEASEPDHESYLHELRAFIRTNGLDDRVTIMTNVPAERMDDVYHAHDVFLLPAVGEPAAYSVVEALCHGLYVLASWDNGTSSYVLSGGRGDIVDFADSDSIERALQGLMRRPTPVAASRAYNMDTAARLETVVAGQGA